MKVKVAYYGYMRNNHTYNMVAFDTEKKTFVSWDGGYSPFAVLVEAKLSRDVDMLREKLKACGYKDANRREQYVY